MMKVQQELRKFLGAILMILACLPAWAAQQVPETIEVTSNAFDHDTDIPWKYSAYDEGISPEISWSNLPEGTRQLALILDDPVVGMLQPFVHWIAYNIPVSATGLPEGLSPDAIVTYPGLEGMINGANGIRRSGYFGPRPPVDGKVHTYNFRIYALDHEMNLADGLNKQSLLDRMQGHILATGLLTGNFEYHGGRQHNP